MQVYSMIAVLVFELKLFAIVSIVVDIYCQLLLMYAGSLGLAFS